MKLRAAVLLIRWYPVPLALLILAFHLGDPFGLATAAQGRVELRFQALRGARTSARVALIPFTSECRTAFPEWPPSLDRYARVMDALLRAGAAGVALELPVAATAATTGPGARDGGPGAAELRRALQGGMPVVAGSLLQV